MTKTAWLAALLVGAALIAVYVWTRRQPEEVYTGPRAGLALSSPVMTVAKVTTVRRTVRGIRLSPPPAGERLFNLSTGGQE